MHRVRSKRWLAIVGVAATAGWLAGARGLVAKEPSEAPFARRLEVHPFPEHRQWFNTTEPIEIRKLHGKFVLLDFWTLGCINCMHQIPELRKLEHAWPKELVVMRASTPPSSPARRPTRASRRRC